MLSLTYLSSATLPMDEAQLVDLLAGFRPRNAASGLTGVLLYADGQFIQTLEGPDEAVRATFARIRRDERHREVIIALAEQIEQRAFPDWSMGFRSVEGTPSGPALPGFNDYLDARRSLLDDDPHRRRVEVFHRIFRDGAGLE